MLTTPYLKPRVHIDLQQHPVRAQQQERASLPAVNNNCDARSSNGSFILSQVLCQATQQWLPRSCMRTVKLTHHPPATPTDMYPSRMMACALRMAPSMPAGRQQQALTVHNMDAR